MEVPPGRVERIADGGPEAIRSILAELRAMKFNGVLKTSVFRGDTPSQGVLVLRRGDGVLAEHRSAVAVAGHEALPEILKDAASARAQLEVRTYDYGHSSISIDHLQRSYPEAAVEGIGDPDEVIEQAIAQEARERETYEKELEGRRNQEQTLVEREEGLYREFASKEATYRDRETSLDARAASLERERKQMHDLYGNLQAEAEKISEARKVFDDRLREAERRERLLAAQEQAIRERELKLRDHIGSVSQRDHAARGKELEQLKRRLDRMDEELSGNRSRMKAQAVKLLRSERTAQQRLRAIETADRELDKREAAAKRREAAIEKREKTALAAEERAAERSDATEVVEGDLRSRRAALEEEYAAKRGEVERRESEVAAVERAFTKESESNESLKATLEEQETAFLSDLQDIESRKAALEKSEASHAQETKKLEKRSDTA